MVAIRVISYTTFINPRCVRPWPVGSTSHTVDGWARLIGVGILEFMELYGVICPIFYHAWYESLRSRLYRAQISTGPDEFIRIN